MKCKETKNVSVKEVLYTVNTLTKWLIKEKFEVWCLTEVYVIISGNYKTQDVMNNKQVRSAALSTIRYHVVPRVCPVLSDTVQTAALF
jgi:hypothetical protein